MPGGNVSERHPETLICTKWDFGWHIVYAFADEVAPILPANTMLHVISWHDNSAANKWNPDPKNWVGYGHRTSDDMGFTWTTYYTLTEEEYQEEKKRATASTSQNNQ